MNWKQTLLGAGAGIALAQAAAMLGDPACGAGVLLAGFARAYDAFGFMAFGFGALTIWLVKLVIDQCRGRALDRRMELDYVYLSRTATLLGLLGTVIHLGSATASVAGGVAAGSAEVILKVIPLTGQALLCTVAGLVIATAAETALHWKERKECAA